MQAADGTDGGSALLHTALGYGAESCGARGDGAVCLQGWDSLEAPPAGDGHIPRGQIDPGERGNLDWSQFRRRFFSATVKCTVINV
jgi:hypothetical protein